MVIIRSITLTKAKETITCTDATCLSTQHCTNKLKHFETLFCDCLKILYTAENVFSQYSTVFDKRGIRKCLTYWGSDRKKCNRQRKMFQKR